MREGESLRRCDDTRGIDQHQGYIEVVVSNMSRPNLEINDMDSITYTDTTQVDSIFRMVGTHHVRINSYASILE